MIMREERDLREKRDVDRLGSRHDCIKKWLEIALAFGTVRGG